MTITALSAQQRNPERINISIDGKYRFSLTLKQVVDYGLKIGSKLTGDELAELEQQSQFGKVYQRTLEYALMRPRSAWEVRQYLYKKTQSRPYLKRSGERAIREGVSSQITDQVFDALLEKGYVNDRKFAQYWVEHRYRLKGISRRKLEAELRAKGVDRSIIDAVIIDSDRQDESEIMKVIAKKRSRYPDNTKLMTYLARQGFSYDDIREALAETTES